MSGVPGGATAMGPPCRRTRARAAQVDAGAVAAHPHEGDIVTVKATGLDRRGKISLSMKDV